jgi:hypothetical protein
MTTPDAPSPLLALLDRPDLTDREKVLALRLRLNVERVRAGLAAARGESPQVVENP